MIFFKKPQEFKPKFEVVGCYCQNGQNMLLLKRHEQKPQGGTYGVPGGKIDAGETPPTAIQREVKEEIGLVLPSDAFMYVGAVFVKYPDYDFVYHMFKTVLTDEQAKRLVLKADEHTELQWITPQLALKENLIQDQDTCIKMCFSL